MPPALTQAMFLDPRQLRNGSVKHNSPSVEHIRVKQESPQPVFTRHTHMSPPGRTEGGKPPNLQPAIAVNIFWRPGEPAPLPMSSQFQSAVVHGRTVYFSHGSKVYAYAVAENKWSSILEVTILAWLLSMTGLQL